MKKIIVILICSAIFAMADRPTDYINGKWYTCDAVKVDTNGDTVYYSSMYGYKKWYTYIKPHKVSKIRWNDGSSCKFSYSAKWLVIGKSCSNGDWYKYTYDKNGNLTKLLSVTGTTTSSYDTLGNKIYEKFVSSKDWNWGPGTTETWYEYDGTTLLSTKMSSGSEGYSRDEITTFYPNGNKKYKKTHISDELGTIRYYKSEEWFDEHGYVTHYKSHTSRKVGTPEKYEAYYKNTYDEKGRIVYEDAAGWLHGSSYQYFESDGIQYKCLVE